MNALLDEHNYSKQLYDEDDDENAVPVVLRAGILVYLGLMLT